MVSLSLASTVFPVFWCLSPLLAVAFPWSACTIRLGIAHETAMSASEWTACRLRFAVPSTKSVYCRRGIALSIAYSSSSLEDVQRLGPSAPDSYTKVDCRHWINKSEHAFRPQSGRVFRDDAHRFVPVIRDVAIR